MTYIYSIKQSSDLYHDLKRMGRDNFTYNGAKALMEYLKDIAKDIGEPCEYDPIAYCCEFTEYSSIESFNDDNDESLTLDQLRDRTTVIEFEGGIIIGQY